MRRWLGIGCILLGFCCLFGAAGLLLHNHWEGKNAQSASAAMVREMGKRLPAAGQDAPVPEESPASFPEPLPQGDPPEMGTIPVGGYDCLGILSIPVLELELPVLANWSYEKLKVAPCHYYGSCHETDFVIAAHNYPGHFGRLPELRAGDRILFADVSGAVHIYEVTLLETLPATATEEMITSGFDLSLYTCTPGGSSRVTVRCTKLPEP